MSSRVSKFNVTLCVTIFLGVFSSAAAFGAEPPAVASKTSGVSTSTLHTYSLKELAISGIYVEQGSNLNSGSLAAAWTPLYGLGQNITLRGNFAVSFLKYLDASGMAKNFTVYDAQIFGRYDFTNVWDGEIGTGIQSWSKGDGVHAEYTANVGYKTNMTWLTRVFAGYSYIQQLGEANEYQAGINLSF